MRLRKARNKVIAHGDAHWDGKNYNAATPEQYGLKWGDPETAVSAAAKVTELWLEGLCAEGHSLTDARTIFGEYSNEFWGHLQTGLRTPRAE